MRLRLTDPAIVPDTPLPQPDPLTKPAPGKTDPPPEFQPGQDPSTLPCTDPVPGTCPLRTDPNAVPEEEALRLLHATIITPKRSL